jgi:hypothetical protein
MMGVLTSSAPKVTRIDYGELAKTDPKAALTSWFDFHSQDHNEEHMTVAPERSAPFYVTRLAEDGQYYGSDRILTEAELLKRKFTLSWTQRDYPWISFEDES